MTTSRSASRRGRRVKIVRRTLADGTVREYRYSGHKVAEPRPVSAIRDLSERYQKSPQFKALSERWQWACVYYLAILEERFGWMTYVDLSSRRCRGEFYDLRDSFSDTPYKADKTLAVLRRLLEWGYDRGMIEVNHAVRIPKLVANNRPRAEIVWTEEHCADFLAAAGDDIGQAFRLALYTGLRSSDLIGIRWEQFDGEWLAVKTRKTGAVVHLPVYLLPPLADLVASLPRCTDYMLNIARGHPWSADNLKKQFGLAMGRAGLGDEDLHWHDLRGTCITRLLDAGCTDAEVGAITGHVIGKGSSIGTYAKRTRALAMNAYRKWAAAMAPSEGNVVALENARKRRENG